MTNDMKPKSNYDNDDDKSNNADQATEEKFKIHEYSKRKEEEAEIENKDGETKSKVERCTKSLLSSEEAQCKEKEGFEGKLSKNQIRKKRRLERQLERKAQRKIQKKEARRAKALAEGRDIEQEQAEQKRRTEQNLLNKKKAKVEEKLYEGIEDTFGVCIDCCYEKDMVYKEINSLAVQIRHSYGVNKRSTKPCRLFVSSLEGKTLELLSKVTGFPDQWQSKAFLNTDEHYTKLFPDKNPSEVFVYLTSDSDTVLQQIQNDKIYIIGGIVDRNRLKSAAYHQAKAYNIPTAKLPIEQNVTVGATKVLTCNHVFEILMKYREYNQNWKKALLDVLPQRKGVVSANDEDDNEK